MSYAIESKKRKFERILESLTDGAAPSRATLNTSNNTSVTVGTGVNSTDSSKRRRITPIGGAQRTTKISTASLTTHYLPSSRLAFLERLESFRQVTKWHVASTNAINAVEWAKRGWVCQDTDTVFCPSCKERCHVDINLENRSAINNNGEEREEDEEDAGSADDDDPLAISNAVLEGLIERYQDMIVTAHTQVCPWRRRGCDDSIQRIEGLLNMPTALSSLEKRYQSMADGDMEIPEVLALPSSEACKPDDQQLITLRLNENENALSTNTLKLAMCGWQRKENDIIECRHCFRSLGLWLYRGTTPTMEHLDAVDSHLEYCPWRCESAQDTELSLTNEKGESRKQKVPGWVLVYMAIIKKNNKGKTPHPRDPSQQLAGTDDENVQPQLSPEQREKKMKDLMKRIRDLKKPFNVKALLKRKEKT